MLNRRLRMEIDAGLVKKLREACGAGIMDLREKSGVLATVEVRVL